MRLNWANAGRLHRDFSRGNEIIPWFGVYIYIYTPTVGQTRAFLVRTQLTQARGSVCSSVERVSVH